MKTLLLLILLTGCTASAPIVREAIIVSVKDITVNMKPVKLVIAVDARGDTITRVLMPVNSVKAGSVLYYIK